MEENKQYLETVPDVRAALEDDDAGDVDELHGPLGEDVGGAKEEGDSE